MNKEQRSLLIIITLAAVSLISAFLAITLGYFGYNDAAVSILLTVYIPCITILTVLIIIRELKSRREEKKHRDYYYQEEQRKREAYLERYWEEERKNN